MAAEHMIDVEILTPEGEVFDGEARQVSTRTEVGEIGILANHRGVLFNEESEKAAQFIQLCNRTDTPLLFVQNITGFMVGSKAEQGGIIRNAKGRELGLPMMQAVSEICLVKGKVLKLS